MGGELSFGMMYGVSSLSVSFPSFFSIKALKEAWVADS